MGRTSLFLDTAEMEMEDINFLVKPFTTFGLHIFLKQILAY